MLARQICFLEEGAYVFITGPAQGQTGGGVKTNWPKCHMRAGDASNLADLDRLYSPVKNEKEKSNVLFATQAGRIAKSAKSRIPLDKTFDLKRLARCFYGTKHFPWFADGGSIFLNGSIASIGLSPPQCLQRGKKSKAAFRSFVAHLACRPQ